MKRKFAIIYGSYYTDSGIYTEVLDEKDTMEDAVTRVNEIIKEDEIDDNRIGSTKQRNDCTWEYCDDFSGTICQYKIQEIKS